jgi:2-polyprenyl-6-methoxyphenol hydroxylase-like FAD-dependent oxidoreductase
MARLIVVGGSLGGLLAANLLVRAGHEVRVLEKSAHSLDGRGAGIVTHEALGVGLQRAGVAIGDDAGDGLHGLGALGVSVTGRVVLDVHGEAVARRVLPQVLTSWSRLYALLSESLPNGCAAMGRTVAAVDADEHGVHVRCDSGETFDADLLVASDGIRSAVRAQLAPEVQPQYAGYIAWRGVCDEAWLSRHTRATLFENFGFGLPAGEQIIGYPVAGAGNTTAPGQRRYNFVWYRAADEHTALPALLTDADGELHANGIAPHKVSWRHVAAMREAARALLAPQFAEIVEKTAQPFLQPIHDLASERLAFGRIALMGDAAFVARPHVGMGVTKAAEDAMALADALAAHGATPAAWTAYEAARLAAGQAVVQRARRLGAYMQAQGHAGGGAARRDAEQVLRETAVATDS